MTRPNPPECCAAVSSKVVTIRIETRAYLELAGDGGPTGPGRPPTHRLELTTHLDRHLHIAERLAAEAEGGGVDYLRQVLQGLTHNVLAMEIPKSPWPAEALAAITSGRLAAAIDFPAHAYPVQGGPTIDEEMGTTGIVVGEGSGRCLPDVDRLNILRELVDQKDIDAAIANGTLQPGKVERPPGAGDLCDACRIEPVDHENGVDTCPACLAAQ